MFFATLFLFLSLQPVSQCEIPWWVNIQNAQDPCWTFERLKSQYAEAEANVDFSRWLTDRPFSKIDFQNSINQVAIIEHPDVFDVNGSSAAGVFRVTMFGSFVFYQLEYALRYEKNSILRILMHELGHMRELQEEVKWNINGHSTFGWWHFGHGDFLDPLVKSLQWVRDWYDRWNMPRTHSYWIGEIGHPPVSGTPGSIPPILPPILPPELQKEVEKFSDFKYHMEHHPEHEKAACILRPQ